MSQSISVVIPAKNAEATIKLCIHSLKNQSRKVDEIIVVDDGSTDKTSFFAKEEGARVINISLTNGRSNARNKGIDNAVGNIVAFLDSDSIADFNWIFNLEEKIKKYDVVSDRRAVYKPNNWYTKCLQANYDIMYSHNYTPKCGWIMKKKIFIKSGKFDLAIAAAEEHDLGRRMIKNNIKIGFAEKAIQYHAGPPRTLRQGLMRIFKHNVLKSNYFMKYPDSINVKNLIFFLLNLIFAGFAISSLAYLKLFIFFNIFWFLTIIFNQGIMKKGFSKASPFLVIGLAFIRFCEHFCEAVGTTIGIFKLSYKNNS